MTSQNVEALDFLFDTNESPYSGNIFICMKSKDVMKTVGRRPITQIVEYITTLKFNSRCDYYFTANSVKHGADRKSDNLFSLNNIGIDIDCHTPNMHPYLREELLETFAGQIERDLRPDLLPNVVSFTGRGIQFFWKIEQVSCELRYFYLTVVTCLCKKIINDVILENSLKYSELTLDTSVSKNLTGLFRLPGSTNPKTGKKVVSKLIHDVPYKLQELFYLVEPDDSIEQQQLTPQKLQKIDKNIMILLKNRLKRVQYAIDRKENHEGMRNFLLFLYYNIAVQLNQKTAKEHLKKINNQLSTPLDSREIGGIIDYIDNRGFLKFKNETFNNWLNWTEVMEMDYREKYPTRTEERARTKKEKAKRKAMAEDLIKSGRHTYDEIAERMGFSRNTIKNIAKTVDKPLPESKTKPWEAIGISQTTYYRRKKAGKL